MINKFNVGIVRFVCVEITMCSWIVYIMLLVSMDEYFPRKVVERRDVFKGKPKF